MEKLNSSGWQRLGNGVLRKVTRPPMVLMMATLAQSLKVFIPIIAAVFVLMMNFCESLRAAAFTCCLFLSPVSRNPGFLWMGRQSAYRRIVTFNRAMATCLEAMLGDLIILPAELALKGELFLIPSANLFTVCAISAMDRTELTLAFYKKLTAWAFHAAIIPIGAA